MAIVPYLPAEMAQVDIDDSNRGFFEACRNHELVIQRCTNCGHFQHPPRALCTQCHSFDLEWAPVNGRGTVFSYTIVHHPIGPVADRVPFNVVVVDLDDTGGARIVSNVIDVPHEDLQVGMPLEVVWEEMSAEITLPRFKKRRL